MGFCGILTSGCDFTDSRQTLSPEVKYMSDTMFAKRKAMINTKVDSICAINFADIRAKAIDSLLQFEKERIAELSEQ